eukprot:m.122842 g.122842  ORF g.122842 m.122842 type:complete len:89 (-) comp21981_c0_seq1:124-390(-)
MSSARQKDYATMKDALQQVSEQVSELNKVHQTLLHHTATVATTVEAFHRAEQLGPYPFTFRPPTAQEAAAAMDKDSSGATSTVTPPMS